MENEPRKATDVLLDIERKIDALFSAMSALDFNVKIISNKLNNLNVAAPIQNTISAPRMEVADHIEKSSSDFQITVDQSPSVFSRSSRSEMHSGVVTKPLQQPNKTPEAETIQVPDNVFIDRKEFMQTELELNKNSIPVQQRVVDKNGKAVFLAGVIINSLATGETVFKGKTNGTGKWAAVITPGSYKVIVSKIESLTKKSVTEVQEILVTGEKAPFELPNLIIQ